MIDAVLFDYGMVLSGPADSVAWERMLEISALDEDRFRAAYWAPRHAYDQGTHRGAEYWLAVGHQVSVEFSSEQVAALIAEDTALWTQVNQPMVDWAGRLQGAGTKTGILSNLGDAITAGVVEKMPWMAAFDFKLFSHTVKLAKPEREIYRIAATGLGVAPERILFVDDRTDNCEGGRTSGLQVIQYGDHEEFVEEMERRRLGELWRKGALRTA